MNVFFVNFPAIALCASVRCCLSCVSYNYRNCCCCFTLALTCLLFLLSSHLILVSCFLFLVPFFDNLHFVVGIILHFRDFFLLLFKVQLLDLNLLVQDFTLKPINSPAITYTGVNLSLPTLVYHEAQTVHMLMHT